MGAAMRFKKKQKKNKTKTDFNAKIKDAFLPNTLIH